MNDLLCKRCGWEGKTEAVKADGNGARHCPLCIRNGRAILLVPLAENAVVRVSPQEQQAAEKAERLARREQRRAERGP